MGLIMTLSGVIKFGVGVFGVMLIGLLSFQPLSAQAQSRPFCSAVEEFEYPGTFRRHSNLPGLLADLMGLTQAATEMRALSSNYELSEHLTQSADWQDLGAINSRRNLDAAFSRLARGDLVVAISILENNRPGQAALLIGSKRHSSNLWPNGVPAGVYYHPTNTNRNFAGCKLSYVWRNPNSLRLFAFSPQAQRVIAEPQIEERSSGLAAADTRSAGGPVQSIRIPVPSYRTTQTQPLSPDRYQGDPVYDADRSLLALTQGAGQTMESVEFEGCVYLHGPKGWVSEWPNLNELQRVDLAEFLDNVPVTKLDIAGGENGADAQFIVGPICDCSTYSKTQARVSRHNFDLHGILREDDHKLTACLGRSRP